MLRLRPERPERASDAKPWTNCASPVTSSTSSALPRIGRVSKSISSSQAVRSAPLPKREAAALTAREHDVVVLVAKGFTNREAAAELYVSKKAVEHHLGDVFAKLGISSRRELPGWTPDEISA